MGAGQPGRTRRRVGKTKVVWPNPYRPVTSTDESRPCRNRINRDRSGQRLCRHDMRPTGDEYDSVRDREREEPSRLILETSAVAEQHKPKGMVGGGERSMVEADEDAETGIRCGTMDEEEADAEIGSTASEGRNAKHTTLSVAGQVTSVHSEEPQRATDDDGRMTPFERQVRGGRHRRRVLA